MTNESTASTTSTLYRGGFVYSPDDPFATAMVVADNQIAWIGSDESAARHADGVDAVVDLDGALVTPTFVDAHVHTSATGMGLRSVELTDVRSVKEALTRIEDAARRRQGRPLYAPNWDEDNWRPEQRPPTAPELDRATYGGVVYAPRVDGHSAVISSALAAASGARNLTGWNDSGLVTREAHHAARDAFRDGISPADRRADIDVALTAAAAAGIGLVHENAGPHLSSAEDLADVLAAGARGDGPQVIGYWAELVADETKALDLVQLHGVRGLAGDLNVDGSIGSRTASLRVPYVDGYNPLDNLDQPHSGNAYLTVEQVRDHVAACSLAGIQAGFHVIGDAGADTVIDGMKAAAAQVGTARVVAARHRLEHLEMVDDAGIKALVELGVTASVQPAFDARWGGPYGMYAARLGRDRVTGMNPFGTMAAAGMSLAFGSDSPVTPFSPWQAVETAAFHHQPTQSISIRAAFLAHTRGGWRVAGIDDRGYLAVGQPASFAIWALGDLPYLEGLPALSPGTSLPTNLRTVICGRTVFAREGALS
ncbi:MAG TPA: amidohydrolase family protein [Dermatophilaceae bacterium]